MQTPFIAWHPIYKLSLPEGHRFPMMKYELLYKQLLYLGIVAESDFFTPEPIDIHELESIHNPDYINRLIHFELTKQEVRRIGLPYTKELLERELRIVQGTVTAANQAFSTGIGFNIAGGTHHAGSYWGEGFCLLNDQAVAASFLQNKLGVRKILIIDLDVHQGNGTAEILKDKTSIFTFSMHGQHNFPFRKEISDWDIGLQDATEGDAYLKLLESSLKELKHFGAEFVFYQAGADVLRSDKLGKMALTLDDCRLRDRLVFEFCHQQNIPIQVSMGGGYSPQIADIVAVHAQTFKEGIEMLLR